MGAHGEQLFQVGATQNVVFDSRVGILQLPSIQEELELSDLQKRTLTKLTTSLKSNRLSVLRNWEDGKKGKAIKQLTEFRSITGKEIDDLLLPFQQKRLLKIKGYLDLCVNGLEGSLKFGRLASQLELTAGEALSLSRKVNRWSKQWRETAKKEVAKINEQIKQILTMRQRDLILSSSPQTTFPIEVYLAQFEMLNADKDSLRRKTNSIYAAYSAIGHYSLRPDATWKFHAPNLSKGSIAMQIVSHLSRTDLGKNFLDPKQLDSIEVFNRELQRKIAAVAKERRDKVRDGASFGEEKKKEIQELEKLYNDAFIFLEKFLSKKQKQAFLDVLESRAVLANGLCSELINGRLGQRLKITLRQRNKLRELCTEMEEKLSKVLQNGHTDLIRTINGELTETQSRIFKDIAFLGLREITPSIEILVRPTDTAQHWQKR